MVCQECFILMMIIVKMMVHEGKVSRVLVDKGRLVDILFYNCFTGLGLRDNKLETYHMTFIGISRETIYPKGIISLEVVIGV